MSYDDFDTSDRKNLNEITEMKIRIIIICDVRCEFKLLKLLRKQNVGIFNNSDLNITRVLNYIIYYTE